MSPGVVKSLFYGSDMTVNVDTLDFSPAKIGDILIRQNLLSVEELDRALLQQQLDPHLKLGEILVRNNSLSLSQLKFYLKNQNVKFGQLLVEKKILKENYLQELLALQGDADNPLGKILIEHTNASKEQIEDVLIEQYLRRKGLFLADTTHHEVVTERSPELTATNQSSN